MTFGYELETKVCSRCGEEKPQSEFYSAYHKKYPHLRRPDCKDCVRLINNNQLTKKWDVPSKPENCEICGKHSETLHLDHCHESGEFRGYLCITCNTGLGKFKDDILLLKKAMNYLEGAKSYTVNRPDGNLFF